MSYLEHLFFNGEVLIIQQEIELVHSKPQWQIDVLLQSADCCLDQLANLRWFKLEYFLRRQKTISVYPKDVAK